MKVAILFAMVAAASAGASPFFYSSNFGFPISGQIPVAGVIPTTYSVQSSVVHTPQVFIPSTFYHAAQPVSFSSPIVYSSGVATNQVFEPEFSDVKPTFNAVQTTFVQPQVFDSKVVPQTYSAAGLPSGYVAKNLGVTHEAPLPEGLGYASYHINVRPAPGTE
ncbi:hypothetical protein HAZT_HAZT004563 [Hyalella azteca]|uniref:Uncharacterized protein LOC108676204 n=1 Tax=Hyalella azteca TaxID=294128 RepID=A0A6A0HDS1_HYAAZ|nr:uncharacterized protein LOC108676204 [Hyalella azteca]KAA0203978.1 hypothetical protein HAZT_HAZT004563 [Hyalella azteca]